MLKAFRESASIMLSRRAHFHGLPGDIASTEFRSFELSSESFTLYFIDGWRVGDDRLLIYFVSPIREFQTSKMATCDAVVEAGHVSLPFYARCRP